MLEKKNSPPLYLLCNLEKPSESRVNKVYGARMPGPSTGWVTGSSYNERRADLTPLCLSFSPSDTYLTGALRQNFRKAF